MQQLVFGLANLSQVCYRMALQPRIREDLHRVDSRSLSLDRLEITEHADQQPDRNHGNRHQRDAELADGPDVDVGGLVPDLGMPKVLVNVQMSPPGGGGSPVSAGASAIA